MLTWHGLTVADWIHARPVWVGVLTLLLSGAVLAGLALLPTHAVSLVCGWLFGAWLGPTIAWLAILGGSVIGFVAGHALAGSGWPEQLRESERWSKLYAALANDSPGRTTGLVALLRFSPAAPFAATNVAFAALGLSWPTFLIGSAIGLAPRVVTVALLGAGMATLDLGRPGHFGLLIAGIVATVIALILIGVIAQRALKRTANKGGTR